MESEPNNFKWKESVKRLTYTMLSTIVLDEEGGSETKAWSREALDSLIRSWEGLEVGWDVLSRGQHK